ncbi:helicase-like protein [Rhodococcus sp. AG1013]|uniref:helicase-related protein n=1 Tax=Rhodococcus sp. AG1013 TaxID=2183996 RepID=UPI000E2C0933|nr:helicase-related protein [Rhodococcus sp. AG1013]RDI24047.1 helicase-like protein [Rhodococcus sp. AG1013]
MSSNLDTTLDEKYRFRTEMVEELARDVIGPGGGENEVISEAPLDRYIIGALWPVDDRRQETPEPDGEESGGSEPTEDSPVAQALMRYPSSVGLTFSVRLADASEITIAIAGASYTAVAVEGDDVEAKKKRSDDWQRVPLALDPVTVSITEPGLCGPKEAVVDGLELYVYVRPPRDGVSTISVALRNTKPAVKGELRDDKAWFQVGIGVSTAVPAIVDRSGHVNVGHDPDLDTSALLYRNKRTFAIGHGCAAEWDTASAGESVDHVATTFLPTYEVSRARPGLLDESVNLRMSFLANGSDEEVVASLRGLAVRYREWIKQLESDLTSGDADVRDELLETARGHVEAARVAADRIEAGIDLLRDDPVSMRAFRLSNQAMQLQRARQDWVRKGAKGAVGDGAEDRWYPFQIAYILLNLPGLADRNHPDRDTADLLWFPTGGGKTEAYLGLVAFSILHRRLQDREAQGVAVIMRYTLRLLTIQQFERATMLMCSLETVRKANSDIGTRPFSIGLWVGGGGTPNTFDEARRSLRDLASGRELQEKNPVQLTQCPWCGTALDHKNYAVLKHPDRHLHIGCGTAGCDFTDGLPVHLVDEDIYRERPELILGTVDKFAAMAWNENVGKLFARDGIGYPPNLIIQDELHLISGPLGSMVGLYETAVDAACSVDPLAESEDRGRPKVIASTATIRRAEKQIRSVFARTAAQFPPPGINPDESFFAEPAPRDTHGTRQYVGIMSPATSHATLLVRVYAALLQAAKDIEGDDATRDPYWTLLGYFNSLRVLGSANLQVEGDVRERLRVVSNRKDTTARELKPANELTSRVASSEIPERLKRIEATLADGKPDDVVLATNMISVGVDIDRLGLMTVMGQPQSSSEYIQATSRVGRKFPGLVVTIFNAARSRDRSHYESFVPYHQALYRAVEATSATPFAARARDRGLHGVLVSLARLLVPGLAPDTAAHLADDNWEDLRKIADILTRRAKTVLEDPAKNGDEEAAEELAATVDQVDALLDVWSEAGEAKPNMRYQNVRNLDAALLVDPAAALIHDHIEYSQNEAPWPTMRSMREVDAESGLYQIAMKRK